MILLLAVAALLFWRQKTEPLLYYSSASYVARAQSLINRGVLVYDCPQRRITFKENTATPADRKWFPASYLRGDVDAFNAQPDLYGHFFVVSDCRLVTINPHLRTVRLPFSRPLQWFGNIDYSGPGANARLQSSMGRTITIETVNPSAAQLTEERTVIAARNSVGANVVHVDFTAEPDPALELHNALDATIFEQRIKASSKGEVRLLGQRLMRGRIGTLRSGDWLHLSAGPEGKSETFLFIGENHPEHASVIQLRNDQHERTYGRDDETILGSVGGESKDELQSLPRAIARAVTHALQDLPEARGHELSTSFDLHLTLDQRLQRAVGAALREHASAVADQQTDGEVFAASATVMNGKTGDVLALATYPADDDLTEADRINRVTMKRLLVNHNFKRHPIGSAGKPFFYAAIADQHPFLTSLVIAPHQPKPNLYGGVGETEDLQYLLASEYKVWNHSDAPMDFESALERSCNKYTVLLGTLALGMSPNDHAAGGSIEEHFRPDAAARWPRSPSGISLGGSQLTFAPSLAGYMKGAPKPVDPELKTEAVLWPGILERVDEAPFMEKLAEITGVRTYQGLAAPGLTPDARARSLDTAYGALAYDLRPWKPLIEMMSEGEGDDVAWKIRAAFQSVAPERVNLAANLITDLRREYLAMLLGGTSSQWTNAQLAEALSRLVTGRAVETNFVRALNEHGQPVQPKPGAAPPRMLELSTGARESVLRGMRRVVEGPRGTASDLAPVLRDVQREFPGANVALFSKTGSPSVYRPNDRPAALLLRYMVEHGQFYFREQAVTVSSRPGRAVRYASLRSAGRRAFVDELSRSVAAASHASAVPANPRTTRRLLSVVDRLHRNLARFSFASPNAVHFDEESSSPIYVLADQLVLNGNDSFFDRATTTDSSAVYIFSLVKWHGDNGVPTPAQLAAPDGRVVTAAIYMDVGPGSTVAVELAAKLIPLLTPYLR
jgi:cell division protein FtsI/penicillin-binding protein 2